MVVHQNAGWARMPDTCDGALMNGLPFLGLSFLGKPLSVVLLTLDQL